MNNTAHPNDLVVALKGYLIGAANVVPGVSGGTFALITGIYQRLIDALNAVLSLSSWKLLLKGSFREFWKAIDGRFLLALACGLIVSVFSLARLITYTLSHWPVETWALFFGLILASAFYMFRDLRPFRSRDFIFAIAGIVLGVAVCTLSPASTPETGFFLFLCGAVAVCSMILPGISGSLMLVLMGKYDFILSALSSFDLPVLVLFGAGCVVGILAFSKFLHWLLSRFERPTMLVLLGFVLGSLVKVWPWSNLEAIALSQGMAETDASLVSGCGEALEAGLSLHILPAVICCLAGIAMVILVERSGRNASREG